MPRLKSHDEPAGTASKVISIQQYRDTASIKITSAQAGADKRKKTTAVLMRLKAGQGLCKIGLAERIGWRALTEIIYEFIDWNRANCYILGNKRAA